MKTKKTTSKKTDKASVPTPKERTRLAKVREAALTAIEQKLKPEQLELPTVEIKAGPLSVKPKEKEEANPSPAPPQEPELPALPPVEDVTVYRVFANANGIVFLRVAEAKNTKESACLFVVNRGRIVELVTVPLSTVRSFEELSIASVRDAANSLLHPPSAAVVVTARARQHLTALLNNKELRDMETAVKEAKKAKFASVNPKVVAKAAKAEKKAVKAAAKKTAGMQRPRINDDVVFTVKGKIDEKLSKKLGNKDCNTHGVVVLRYLLKTGSAKFGKLVKDVTAGGKYETASKSATPFILGDLRIFQKAGLVTSDEAKA
jgi:hypothetical protein